MAPNLGRKITDLTQKTKGRQALRFQLELIPYCLGESKRVCSVSYAALPACQIICWS